MYEPFYGVSQLVIFIFCVTSWNFRLLGPRNLLSFTKIRCKCFDVCCTTSYPWRPHISTTITITPTACTKEKYQKYKSKGTGITGDFFSLLLLNLQVLKIELTDHFDTIVAKFQITWYENQNWKLLLESTLKKLLLESKLKKFCHHSQMGRHIASSHEIASSNPLNVVFFIFFCEHKRIFFLQNFSKYVYYWIHTSVHIHKYWRCLNFKHEPFEMRQPASFYFIYYSFLYSNL